MSLRHVVKETIADTEENLIVRAHSTNLKFKWGSVYFPLYFRHLTVGSFIFLLIAQALFSLIGHLNSRRFGSRMFYSWSTSSRETGVQADISDMVPVQQPRQETLQSQSITSVRAGTILSLVSVPIVRCGVDFFSFVTRH